MVFDKKKFEKVLHEFKQHELRAYHDGIVNSKEQALAIAFSEARHGKKR